MKKNRNPWMPSLTVLALALLALPIVAVAQEEAPEEAPDPYLYAIDAGHSEIGFKVRHFTVSYVRGDFVTFEGAIRYNPDDLADSGVEVVIDAASIDTDHDQRDEHLRSPDFLDVANHSKLTFKSTKVEPGSDGEMMITGELTMRGVTKEVSFPFEMVGPITDPLGLQRIGVEGELTIDRRDWGLEWSRAMETGGLFVGHEVKIELSAEATRK